MQQYTCFLKVTDVVVYIFFPTEQTPESRVQTVKSILDETVPWSIAQIVLQSRLLSFGKFETQQHKVPNVEDVVKYMSFPAGQTPLELRLQIEESTLFERTPSSIAQIVSQSMQVSNSKSSQI